MANEIHTKQTAEDNSLQLESLTFENTQNNSFVNKSILFFVKWKCTWLIIT